MSLYNMIGGVNPATFVILPMLGRHPDEYPRFRNCFVGAADEDGCIVVYTRTGDEVGYEDAVAAMTTVPTFRFRRVDRGDPTYARYVFGVPDKWRPDFDRIIAGDLYGVSDEYVAEAARVYPKIADKLRALFGRPEAPVP